MAAEKCIETAEMKNLESRRVHPLADQKAGLELTGVKLLKRLFRDCR